jgi:hypothetical protein
MDQVVGGTSNGQSGGQQAPPPAVGVRLPWSAVPVDLRDAVEERLGGRVVEAVTQPGGFSPGVAARLRLSEGNRAFVKAVGPAPNPDSPDIYRAEVRIAAALPDQTPAPRLLGSFDRDGWVVLLFEDVEGAMPAQPWITAELDRVLDALGDLAKSLTPAPWKHRPSRSGSAINSRDGVASQRRTAAVTTRWMVSTLGRAGT